MTAVNTGTLGTILQLFAQQLSTLVFTGYKLPMPNSVYFPGSEIIYIVFEKQSSTDIPLVAKFQSHTTRTLQQLKRYRFSSRITEHLSGETLHSAIVGSSVVCL
jgi:hypothetical protein